MCLKLSFLKRFQCKIEKASQVVTVLLCIIHSGVFVLVCFLWVALKKRKGISSVCFLLHPSGDIFAILSGAIHSFKSILEASIICNPCGHINKNKWSLKICRCCARMYSFELIFGKLVWFIGRTLSGERAKISALVYVVHWILNSVLLSITRSQIPYMPTCALYFHWIFYPA